MTDSIKLNWVIESTNQTEQRIYRKIDDSPEELLATVPVSSVEYSDTTAPGLMTTQASYRVESVGVYRGVETIKTSLTETYTVPIQSNGLAGMTSADKNLSVVALEPISLWVNGIAVETESTESPYQYTSPSTGEARYVQLSSVDNTSPIPIVLFLSGFDTLEEWGRLGLGVVSLGPDILTVPDHIPESLTNLSMMFANSTKFNDPNVTLWDVSNVTNMSNMFTSASAFNQDISSWNVANVTDMSGMFQNATAFNQNLTSWCVPLISEAPVDFATGSSLTLPVWGTCPSAIVTITEPMNIVMGETLTAQFTTVPVMSRNDVTWELETGDVATVDPTTGVITPVAPGEDIITVTINGVNTDIATVTVTASA